MERCNLKQTSGQRNDGIAILKAIAAFMVVWIHLGVHGAGNPAVYAVTKYADALCRMAVPVFFIITGYFFSGYMDRTWPKLKKLLTLTITASVLYVILDLWTGDEYRNLISETKWIPHFLIYNIFPPFAGHLWYMYCLLYTSPSPRD